MGSYFEPFPNRTTGRTSELLTMVNNDNNNGFPDTVSDRVIAGVLC